MLYRENEILIFYEFTAVLTPQEIEELMQIMKNLAKEGKSILFISHKLNEIMAVADRCSVLRKGKYSILCTIHSLLFVSFPEMSRERHLKEIFEMTKEGRNILRFPV